MCGKIVIVQQKVGSCASVNRVEGEDPFLLHLIKDDESEG
jgi:hypothetical protein